MRYKIQKPDYRNNDKYQFITGYGGGMQTVSCVHLTKEEISKRCEKQVGPGQLIDDGENLWWGDK